MACHVEGPRTGPLLPNHHQLESSPKKEANQYNIMAKRYHDQCCQKSQNVMKSKDRCITSILAIPKVIQKYKQWFFYPIPRSESWLKSVLIIFFLHGPLNLLHYNFPTISLPNEKWDIRKKCPEHWDPVMPSLGGHGLFNGIGTMAHSKMELTTAMTFPRLLEQARGVIDLTGRWLCT